MTTVYAIDHLPAEASVGVTSVLYDPSDFSLIASDATDTSAKADYKLPSGDPNYPCLAHIRVSVDPKANGGMGVAHYSLRVETWQTTTVDSVLVSTDPLDVVIAWNVPGKGIANPTDMLKLITGAYGLLFTLGSNPGAPLTTVLTTLAFGIPDIL